MAHIRPDVDSKRLRLLWDNEDLTQAEMARELGLSHGQFEYAVRLAGLPKRPPVTRVFSPAHLSPEEIRIRAEAVKAISLAKRAAESEKATETRILREAQEQKRKARLK